MADKDDYNPYDFREVAHPMTDFGAFANLLKAILGSGILAAPMAFRNAGYIPAIISTVVIGFLIIYSKFILLDGMYELEKRKRVPLITYSEAMIIAVTEGPPSLRWLKSIIRCVVNTMLVVNHFGACCVYVVFIANCLKDFGDYYWTVLDNRYYMLMEIVPLCLIFYITNLNALVPFVHVANISLIFGFTILFYYIFTDMGPFSGMDTFQNIYYYPFFFGATMFAFDAPGLVVAIEANMKNPGHFRTICGVYVRAMIIIIAFQIVFAFFGYWSWGEELASTVLQNLPSNAVLSTIARIIFALSLYISHPLQGYVPVDVVWNNWLKEKVPENRQLAWELVVRTIIALLSVFFGVACPNLTLILSFTGALSLSLLGLILPALLDICVRFETGYGPIKLYLMMAILLIVAGFAGAGVSTYVSIQEVVLMYTNSSNVKVLGIWSLSMQ